MDKDLRTTLLNTTQATRRLLEEGFSEQLEGTFDIFASGEIKDPPSAPLTPEQRLVRGKIIAAIRHRRGKGETDKESVAGYRRECAFTLLNRLAALKMMEARAIIQPCVSQGPESSGFREFCGLAPGLAALPDKGYRLYLECLFDEIGREVGVLFDRADPASLLWPTRISLDAVLEKLNAPALASVWAEDETIGWIYQYYNDPDERKQMRDESSTPRNSRELAVRNQFFTPRYVVEFLTDNTLGRIWYEMTKGATALKDRCRYLIRPPGEIFLIPQSQDYALSQDDWVKSVALSADFTQLPENPTTDQAARFALMIDGYGLIEKIETRRGVDAADAVQSFADRTLNKMLDSAGNCTADWHGTLLELWCTLFLVQRQVWREGGSISNVSGAYRGTLSMDPPAHALWLALRTALLAHHAAGNAAATPEAPVFIAHRPLRDPRSLRLLDPACGSMHFGLYAFDLLEVIYREAYDRSLIDRNDYGAAVPPFPHASVRKDTAITRAKSNDTHREIDLATARIVMIKDSDYGDGMSHTGPYLAPPERNYRTGVAREIPYSDFDYVAALASGWMTEAEGERLVRETSIFLHDRADPLSWHEIADAFRRDIPRLIIEHNIHGIDIDPRAAQIAALALWLRAQRSWRTFGVAAKDRPAIRRSHIVCAAPMPGDNALLDEFVTKEIPAQDRPVFSILLRGAFEHMKLAGDAGSLLRIEEAIAFAVDDARSLWRKNQKRTAELFDTATINRTLRPGAQQELTDLESAVAATADADFWSTLEPRLYAYLAAYADHSAATAYAGRLFADDAAQGFAFIDNCRERYDVVVMNPPFGEWSAKYKAQSRKAYPNSYNDILGAFVERGGELLVPGGRLGAITSRTCFFLSSFTKWREEVVLKQLRPEFLVDLGNRVMDDAMVEAAAYVLAKPVNTISAS